MLRKVHLTSMRLYLVVNDTRSSIFYSMYYVHVIDMLMHESNILHVYLHPLLQVSETLTIASGALPQVFSILNALTLSLIGVCDLTFSFTGVRDD